MLDIQVDACLLRIDADFYCIVNGTGSISADVRKKTRIDVYRLTGTKILSRRTGEGLIILMEEKTADGRLLYVQIHVPSPGCGCASINTQLFFVFCLGGAHNAMQLTWLAQIHQLCEEGAAPLDVVPPLGKYINV